MEKFNGVIVKHFDYMESSLILHVYTIEGMKSVLVRGGKKFKSPFLGAQNTMSFVEFHASGKAMMTAKEMTLLDSFPGIRSSVEKTTYASHMLELIEHFADGGIDHKKAFPFLVKILAKIDVETEYIPYVNMFESKLLYLLGVNPHFRECVVCQSHDHLSFSIQEGGMICDDHPHANNEYSHQCVELFEFLYYYDLQHPSSIETDHETLAELRHLLDAYYWYHLQIKTKSRIVLEGFLGY